MGNPRTIWPKSAALSLMATHLLVVTPAHSQEPVAEARIRKMEAEIRALQRNVFPGGAGQLFMPQIRNAPAVAPTVGHPATPPIADLHLRMDSVESHLVGLGKQLREIQERIARLGVRLEAQKEDSASTAGKSQPTHALANRTSPPSAKRLAAVRAIVKPHTANTGEDEYSYGFRLWQANLYSEAQQQLKIFIARFPHHARISFARNLLGRAFLDAGNPLEGAKWFLENYHAGRTEPRSPDSLLYLSDSMYRLKDTKRSCVALREFVDVYATRVPDRLRALYDGMREKCSPPVP